MHRFTQRITQRKLTRSDAAGYIALTDAISDADGGDHRVDEEEFRHLLEYPLGVEDLDDFQGFFAGDQMVAAGWACRRTVAEPVHWMATDGGVHPDFRGQGLGTQLVRWQEEVSRKVHERYFPGHPLELSLSCETSNRGAVELFEAEGYTPKRWFSHMIRAKGAAIPDATVPEGLEIQQIAAEVVDELRHTHNQVFLDHWRFTPTDEDTWHARFTRANHCADVSFLMRDSASGEIAGYLLSSYNEAEHASTGIRDVHFSLVGTPRAYRKRGVAAGLLAHAIRRSRDLGFETASIGVDAENPSGAVGIYERSGFEAVTGSVTYGKMLVEA